jgi:hypothetical protein
VDARHGSGSGGVDRPDPCVRVRASQEDGVSHARAAEVADEAAPAREKLCILSPRHATADPTRHQRAAAAAAAFARLGCAIPSARSWSNLKVASVTPSTIPA